ncbi:MAG TPA: DUF6265 family protein [Thermoanaerobaculia bacterium]|nr:DUF6265 family protein [Thermoanaerobaculia bacterium]
MKTLALAALLLFAASVNAADATVDDMAWLAGHWTGTGLGGHCTETWSPVDNGVMLGTFRLVREGKPVFYEFLAVGMFEGKLAMRLKHFNADITGWEQPEKFVEFKHTKTDGNTIEFEGLRFVREGKDKVTIFLKLRGKDGAVREEKFEMQR